MIILEEMMGQRKYKYCTMNNCNREHHARGFCNRHYKQLLRNKLNKKDGELKLVIKNLIGVLEND